VSRPAPDIAVVVPTRRRETRLAFLLDALAEQTLDAQRFETIVVRDGDWQGPRTAPPKGLEVRFASQPDPRGPASARNVGWRMARAPLVAFTDDDCRPSPRWLAELVRAAGRPGVFVQGRTEPDPDERHLLGGLARSQLIEGPTIASQTCNMAYPRELLERLGGFDEGYGFPAAEDTDLGLRARAAGAEPVFSDAALVWHAVVPRHLSRALRETVRWKDVASLLARHPEFRSVLRYRWFWKDSHAKLLLALVGAVALRRRPALALAAAAPYLELHLRQYDATPRGRARAGLDLPARVTVDVAEVVAVAAGALRHRVALL
jgi:GT2 family glycosyltransferase